MKFDLTGTPDISQRIEPIGQHKSVGSHVLSRHSSVHVSSPNLELTLPSKNPGETVATNKHQSDGVEMLQTGSDEGEIADFSPELRVDDEPMANQIDTEEAYEPPVTLDAISATNSPLTSDDRNIPQLTEVNDLSVAKTESPISVKDRIGTEMLGAVVEASSTTGAQTDGRESGYDLPSNSSDSDDYEPPETTALVESAAMSLNTTIQNTNGSYSPKYSEPENSDLYQKSDSPLDIKSEENLPINKIKSSEVVGVCYTISLSSYANLP